MEKPAKKKRAPRKKVAPKLKETPLAVAEPPQAPTVVPVPTPPPAPEMAVIPQPVEPQPMPAVPGICFGEVMSRLTFYGIEIPAGLRWIRYRPIKASGPSFEYILSWPPSLWCFSVFDNHTMGTPMRLFFLKEPYTVKGLDTELLGCPMPNVYGNGGICLYTAQYPTGVVPDRAALLRDTMAGMLYSTWNEGCSGKYEQSGLVGQAHDGMKDWAAKSAADPEFYKQLKLVPSRTKTVKDLFVEAKLGKVY